MAQHLYILPTYTDPYITRDDDQQRAGEIPAAPATAAEKTHADARAAISRKLDDGEVRVPVFD